MGSKRLKVQKQLPQHQFNVPVYSMDDICLQNKPIIPDTIKNVKIYFDVNAHAIQDSSKATVKEISENLKASKERYYVVIAGYADITGDPAKNMELSKKRAEAIKNMLIEYDVNPRLIEIKYYGAVLEKDLNQARRVEVIFLKKTKRNSF
jgi:outer membrane protein OmpA-like peptidoglycan-associated protein